MREVIAGILCLAIYGGTILTLEGAGVDLDVRGQAGVSILSVVAAVVLTLNWARR